MWYMGRQPAAQPSCITRPAATFVNYEYKVKVQACTGPKGSMEVEGPRFQDSRHMKMVKLSALRPGRLFPPPPTEKIPGTHFCQRLSK